MKIYKIIIFFICIFILNGLCKGWASDVATNNTSDTLYGGITLKSRRVLFDKSSSNIVFSDDKVVKRIYLKFNTTITQAIIRKLARYDIFLDDYITNNTYIAKVDNTKLSHLEKLSFIQGFAEIDISDKMSTELYNKFIESWSIDNSDAKFLVSFYDDISYNEAATDIVSIGGKVESQQFSYTMKLIVSIEKSYLLDLASLEIVKYVEELPQGISPNSVNAGILSNVFREDTGEPLSGLFDTPYDLKGLGINIAVRDYGAIYNHSDLSGRLFIVDNDNISSHATHIAGIIAGTFHLNETPPKGGMASLANLFSFSITNDNSFTDDFLYSILICNASIINNSWGVDIGWEDEIFYDNQNLFGEYTSDTEDMDGLIYSYFDEYALIIKSAGNHRDDSGVGHPHDGNDVDNDGNYYDCIDPLASAKNTITVGSVGTSADAYISSDCSSWGPTDDGRLKPDVVADGYELYSTYPNDEYCYESGSSMATGVVSGISALIFEAYDKIYGEYPTADIVKALLCNFALDLGKPGPDFSYGFGLVDAESAIQAIYNYDESAGGHIVTSIISETGENIIYNITITSGINDNKPLVLTLAWIDPPANPSVTNAIINDLDIVVEDNDGNVYYPFYFKPYDDTPNPQWEEPVVDPTESAKTGINRYDTVEQIVIPLDNDGSLKEGNYTIRISGHKILLINQPFALVTSVGINKLHFNTIKIKDEEEEWRTSHYTVIDETPDVRLMVSEFGEGFYTSTVKYSYSNDGGSGWSDWTDVTGIYVDENCSIPCGVTHCGVAYIKQENIPFNSVSLNDNRIKFRVEYQQTNQISPIYIVKNHNIYHVSAEIGDDSNGTGTETNPWQTISHALISASARSAVPAKIYVQQGTYNENIVLREYVYLYGGYDSDWERSVLTNETVIQGTGTTHVVIGDDYTILDGFIVTNGNANTGGGIYLFQTSPKIRNCTIQSNTAEDNSGDPSGGGLYAYESSAIIDNCKISNNNATTSATTYSASGAGACIINSSVQLMNTTFLTNECVSTAETGFARGGGLYLLNDSSTIINTIFRENITSSQDEAFGAAIYCANSTSRFLGCIISFNETESGFLFGEAIYFTNAPSAILTNCTIYGNTEGGIRISGQSCQITNCILWGHTGNDISGTVDNSKITYSCIEDAIGGIGCIHTNPTFRNVNSKKLNISIESPCIDAGNDNASSLEILKKDIDGDPRLFFFSNATNIVDIGADEYRWSISSYEMDNDAICLEWESKGNETYYVEYTNDNIFNLPLPHLHFKCNENDNDSMVCDSINSINGVAYDNEGECNTEEFDIVGKINNAFTFDGNQYITCGNTGNITSDLSVFAWVYVDNSSQNRTVISKSGNNAYRLLVNENGKISVFINDGSGAEEKSSSNSIPIAQWVHIGISIDFSSEEIKFYINGTLDTTLAITKTCIAQSNNDFIIGAYDTNLYDAWIGYLDDIRIYDCALNEERITNLYSQGAGTENKNLITWIRISQGISGQSGNTSWQDDSSQTSPDLDNDSLTHRFYKIVCD